MNSMPSGAFSSQKENVPSGYKKFSLQNFPPEMMQLFRQALERLGPEGFLSKLASGDQSMFEEMERPALKQFGEMQGNIASRFSGLGGAGSLSSQNSSGFQNAMNTAASDFAEKLQANRLNLQQGAQQDLMNFTNQMLNQKPYEQGLVAKAPKSPSKWGGLIGTGLGALAGSPFGAQGAMTGAKLGYGIGSQF